MSTPEPLVAARRLRNVTERQVDPWGDMPRWSDDEQRDAGTASGGPVAPPMSTAPAFAAGADAAATGADAEVAASESGPATCPWCATPATEGAKTCTSCGAALAQREAIGDLVIPGLTAVDPALKDLADRPLHLSGPSPSHGVASGAVVAAAAGGPLGLVILGGVGAVAAAEYLGASRETGSAKGHENVGETSEAVLQAIERLERGEDLPSASDTTPRPELEAQPAAPEAQSAPPEDDTMEASDGGH